MNAYKLVLVLTFLQIMLFVGNSVLIDKGVGRLSLKLNCREKKKF